METITENHKFTYFTDDGLEFSIYLPAYWDTIYKGKPRERLYEEYIQMLNIVKKLPKDKILVDIGANNGLFCIPASMYGYRCVAFEPVKSTFDDLYENCRKNSLCRVDLFNYAVSNEDGQTTIYVPECPDNASLSKEASVANMIRKGYHEEVVKTIRFDTFIKENPQYSNIGLIKADLQGSEGLFIESGKEFLSQAKDIYLILEYEPHLLKMNWTYEQLDSLIHSLGFKQVGKISNDKIFKK